MWADDFVELTFRLSKNIHIKLRFSSSEIRTFFCYRLNYNFVSIGEVIVIISGGFIFGYLNLLDLR